MKVKAATFTVSAPDLRSCPDSALPEFAFIGRSNVGKSSMINMLAGQKALARVSGTPGFTKLINFFDIDHAWTLVDLPGYGYAKIAKKNRSAFNESVADYLEHRPNLRCAFVLIDSRLEPQRLDLEFLAWLTSRDVPVALVFTKTDKVKPRELAGNMAAFQCRLAEACGAQPRSFASSALQREGRAEILGFIATQLDPTAGEEFFDPARRSL